MRLPLSLGLESAQRSSLECIKHVPRCSLASRCIDHRAPGDWMRNTTDAAHKCQKQPRDQHRQTFLSSLAHEQTPVLATSSVFRTTRLPSLDLPVYFLIFTLLISALERSCYLCYRTAMSYSIHFQRPRQGPTMATSFSTPLSFLVPFPPSCKHST
jgi:hypothetical protein